MTGAPSEPSAPLIEWAETTLGSVKSWRDASWDHAESEVWEAHLEGGGHAYLKCHRQPQKFAQERDAYERWAPAVGGCPTVLATKSESPRALLIESVSGEPLVRATCTPEREARHYERAGRWLRRLHALPWADDDAMGIPEALTKRSLAWSERARGKLESDLIRSIHERVAAPWPTGFPPPSRVPCHRDFTARNWIVAGDHFHVIDFEHSRADWCLVDVERVRSSIPSARPELWRAFLAGYGEEPHEDLLDRLELHAALARVVWAVEHGDVAFERAGRASIAARLELN